MISWWKRVRSLNALYFFLNLCGLNLPSAHSADKDVIYTKLNENSFLIEYRPAEVMVRMDTINGNQVARVSLQHGATLCETGRPPLPYRTLFAAVPEAGRLLCAVQSLEYQEPQQVALADYHPDSISTVTETAGGSNPDWSDQETFIPAQVCQLESQIRLRRQPVIPIRLFPVQYHPRQKRMRMIRKMVLRFDITATDAGRADLNANPIREPAFADFFADKIINHDMLTAHAAAPANKRLSQSAPSREWYKIAIEEDGLYRLDYSFIQNIGYDSTTLDLSHTGLFTLGGRELDLSLTAAEPTLQQVAVLFQDHNQDGRWGMHDTMLFYGQAVDGWSLNEDSRSYEHHIHHYARQNMYWLNVTDCNPYTMEKRPARPIDAETPTVRRKAIGRLFVEPEIYNNAKSGYQWYWDWFNGNQAGHYTIAAPNLSAADTAQLKLHFQGASEHHHYLTVYVNKQPLERLDLYYTLAKTYTWPVQAMLTGQEDQLHIVQQSVSGQKDEVYLDWLELEYRQHLDLHKGVVEFWSEPGSGWRQYQLQSASGQTVVVDITDPYAAKWIEPEIDDSIATFQDQGEKRYLALALDQAKPIAGLESKARQFPLLRTNDHQADYLIIAPEDLTGAALEKLAAHRRDPRFWPHDGPPQVMITTIEQIYDEFSGGLVDPTAVRNFLRYAYGQWAVAPSYVLLVGDACYDLKNNGGAAPITLIPTYEEKEIATDDWFVCLESEHVPAMYLGRLPVHNQEELSMVVQKIITYDTALQPGPWKNTLLFVADDDYSPANKYEDYVFGFDSERMAADSSVRRFDSHKIYLTEYKRDAFGKKPQAMQDLLDQINQGCLYINFLGHGNVEVLTHESILNSPDDMSYLHNDGRWPLFFAGTCAVGQFDYDRKNSMAEELLLHQAGGCMAVIAATRWNAHIITSAINQDFFSSVFSSTGTAPSLGQALLAAKLNSRYPEHRELLALFGDPAQRLAVPRYFVQATVAPDTLSLRKNVLLKGALIDQKARLDQFNGNLFVKLYQNVYKRYASEYTYDLTGPVLYADTLSVHQGLINQRFFLSSDSTKGGQTGRMVFYAWESDGAHREASGFLDRLLIKADTLATDFRHDREGPEIQLAVNGVKAEPQTEIVVEPAFQLTFSLKDALSGIWRKPASEYSITIEIDHSPDSLWDVTSQFIAEDGEGKSGSVAYTFDQMAVGKHVLELSVWDNALNHSTVEWSLEVAPQEFSLQEVLTYPNPASRNTFFTFTLSHDAEVLIKMYTIAGRCIQTIRGEAASGFNKIPEEGWACTDHEGDLLANGVYLYKIIAHEKNSDYRNSGNRTCEAIGRLVIMR